LLITCSLSAEGSVTPAKGHHSWELVFQLKGSAVYVALPSSSALTAQCWCLQTLCKSTVIPAFTCEETEARRDLRVLSLRTRGHVTTCVPSAAWWHLAWGGEMRPWDISRWAEAALPWLPASQGCALLVPVLGATIAFTALWRPL